MSELFGSFNERYDRIKVLFDSRTLCTYRLASEIDLAIKDEKIPHADLQILPGALDDMPYDYQYEILDYSKVVMPELKEHTDRFVACFY